MGADPGRRRAERAVTRNHSLWDAVAVVLGLDKVTVLATDEGIRAAEREQ